MKTVLTIISIRPDYIRLAETIRRLDKEESIHHILVNTNQHYDDNLSSVFLKDLEIRAPDFNLGVGAPGKQHFEQHADLTVKLVRLCQDLKPDLVLGLGDSNGMLSLLSVKKEGFAVARIEAGMRAGPKAEWMPEEINRQAADRVCSLLFAYTDGCVENLKKENVSGQIFNVGNTLVEPVGRFFNPNLDYFTVPQHIVCDIHRHEDYQKDRLQAILTLANAFGQEFGLPVKMLRFGRTFDAIERFGLKLGSEIQVVGLMGFKDYLKFQQAAKFVFSSSGSAEEECALLGIPVVVPRDFTERPEASAAGNSLLIDVLDRKSFVKASEWVHTFKPGNTNWLGDGKTSESITSHMKTFLSQELK